MTSIYPIHLIIGGEEWFSCIVNQYPATREAYTGYIFIPTSFVVCAMFFGVTLLRRFVQFFFYLTEKFFPGENLAIICFRKILTPVQFAAVYGFGVWNIFIATTLYQEIHIPFVSSQKLVLPCETPTPGSWLEYLGELLILGR